MYPAPHVLAAAMKFGTVTHAFHTVSSLLRKFGVVFTPRRAPRAPELFLSARLDLKMPRSELLSEPRFGRNAHPASLAVADASLAL